MNIADRHFARSADKPLAADTTEAHELFGEEPDWSIDPRTVLRLWPVIDVYGRIARAHRSAATITAHSGAA
ncbi:MAG: hypothetical protein ACKV2O_02270 [Acidimicrobiales bacterium]